jgi:hypothetical protein
MPSMKHSPIYNGTEVAANRVGYVPKYDQGLRNLQQNYVRLTTAAAADH